MLVDRCGGVGGVARIMVAGGGARMTGADRVAVITGGGAGIGRAIAEAFAEDGMTVAVVGRTEASLTQTVTGIEGVGGSASAHVGDVSLAVDARRTFAEVLARHGRVDVLVNNAGIAGPTAPVHEVDLASWDEVQAINVRGAFLCTQLAAAHMVERGSGHILFLSALGGGLRAYPGRLPYAVSKAAVLAMAQTVAAELRPFGVRVNALTPGPVRGKRLSAVLARQAEQSGRAVKEVAQALAARAPCRGFPDEREIARIALFLCGPDADFIVGQSINVTSGMDILQ